MHGNLTLVDVTGDSKLEVVVGEWDSNVYYASPAKVYVIDSAGNKVWDYTFPDDTIPFAEDVDGNGKAEVVVYWGRPQLRSEGYVTMFNSDGSIRWSTTVSGCAWGGIFFVDINGDGIKETVATRTSNNDILIFNSLTGTMSAISNNYGLVTGILGNRFLTCKANTLYALDLSGNKIWEVPIGGNPPPGMPYLPTADLNGDGKDEILAGSDMSVNVLGSDGSVIWSTSSSRVWEARIGDIDSDSLLDLIIGTETKLTVYKNQMGIGPPVEHPIKLGVIQKPIVNPEGPEFQVRLENTVSELLVVRTKVEVNSYQALIYTEEKISFIGGYSATDLTFSAPICIVNNLALTVNFVAEYIYEGYNLEEKQKVAAIASNEIEMPNSLGGVVMVMDDPQDNTLTLHPSQWDPKWKACIITSNNFKTAIFGFESDLSIQKYLELYPTTLDAMPQPVRDNLNTIYQGAQFTGDYIDFWILVRDQSRIKPKHVPIPLKIWEDWGYLWDAACITEDAVEVFDDIRKNPFPATNAEQHQRILSVVEIGIDAACIGILGGMLFTGPVAVAAGIGCVAYSGLKFLQSVSSSETSSCVIRPLLEETISTAIEPGYTCPSARINMVQVSSQSGVTIYESIIPSSMNPKLMLPLVREGSGSNYIAGLVLEEYYDPVTGKTIFIPTATSRIETYRDVKNIEQLIYDTEYPNEHEVVLRAIGPREHTRVYLQEQDHDLSLTVQANGDYVGLDSNGYVHVGIPGAWFSGSTWPIKEILLPNWLSSFDIIVNASSAVLPTERFDLTVSCIKSY
jgi:hypothetical protein